MPNDPTPERKGPLRRFGPTVAIFAAALLAILATGMPQRAVVENILSDRLGGDVRLTGLKLFGSLTIDRLELAGIALDGGLLPPVFSAENVRIDYNLFGGRKIGPIEVGAIRVNLESRRGTESNYAFLAGQESPAAATEPIDPAWLPESVTVGQIDISVIQNEAEFRGGPVGLEASFAESGSATVSLKSSDLAARFSSTVEGIEGALVTGTLSVEAQVTGDAIVIEGALVLEDTGDCLFRSVVRLDRSWLEAGVSLATLDATIDSASLDGNVLADFIAGLTGGEVGFGKIVAEPTKVHIDFSEAGALPTVHGGALVQGLRLGSSETPRYQGDAVLTIALNDAGEGGEILLSLDDRHVIRATVEGSKTEGRAAIRAEGWTKDRILAIAPSASSLFFSGLDFGKLDASAELVWRNGTQEATGTLNAYTDSTEVMTAGFTAFRNAEGIGAVTIESKIEGGDLLARYEDLSPDAFDASLSVESLDLNHALRLFANLSPPDGAKGTLSGTATVKGEEGAEAFPLRAAFTLAPVRVESIGFELVTVELHGEVSSALDAFTVARLDIKGDDGTSRASLIGVTGTVDPLQAAGEFELVLDAATAGAWIDMPDLWGEFASDGSFELHENQLVIPAKLHTDLLGSGDITLPYGREVSAMLRILLNLDTLKGEIEAFEARAGEGTRMAFAPSSFSLDPIAIETSAVLDTDFEIFVEMGLFAEVDGSGRFEFGGICADTPDIEWSLDLNFTQVLFPDEIASAENLRLTITGAMRDALDGKGEVRAEVVTVAGGRLTGTSGPATVDDDAMRLPDLRGDIFGGRFVGQVEARIFETGLPVRVSGRIDDFDLARFTEEVQPPETQLTGIANATFAIENSMEGLQDFEFYADSSENFTLNRDMVRTILESEAFRATLGLSQIEKTLNKFLGSAPQRPFEEASLRLRDEADRVLGTAVLKSQKTKDYNGLNLTIELAIDNEALAQSLKMLEESQTLNVHF